MSQADFQAQIISEAAVLTTTTYLELAATALFFYDYLLTFAQEVKCIWARKPTGASFLFALNRYAVFVNRLVRLVQLMSWKGFLEKDADRTWVLPHLLLGWALMPATLQVQRNMEAIAGFSALRMYAIYGKDRRILAFVLTLGLVNPCVNIYYNTTLMFQAMPPPFKGCGQESSLDVTNGNQTTDLALMRHSPSSYHPTTVVLFGAIFTILFESIVLALTWNRTADIWTMLRKRQSHTGLVELLCRDGTIYFLVLLVLTGLSMISIRDQMFNNMPAITDTLTSICLARFMLNLRSIGLKSGRLTSSSSGSTLPYGDLKFATCRFVGNLGAPLSVAPVSVAEDEHDLNNPQVLQEALDRHEVCDDPLMEGIVMEME
ncbi:hypothetical protein PHLGIDRAFT_118417 [Phlebiopsis gigantea 11061_1 CR5-6]|uniref:DUF6533 domain-containing protein n=1 Tax=Phlebiopsis gigantea (strain 11061_1 CR5-6) TaxID=745531 RepID=A0A0C3PKZ5_PHLG1|nr:hypothetical protein PHLGIDRAFT_118417 [Phlebiopsis gigantea 11061_1 CR5-6]